jgi:2,4-dienoyl-CoA reductase-like NADH-dependent reductase (Old Yellow Enzyme family)
MEPLMPDKEVHLFSPIQLRTVTARNRIWISPMCQYSVFKEDGVATSWHMVHLGSRAVGGAGLIIVEATAVEARGRISARDLGLWNEEQAAALAPVVSFMTEHGAVPVIQLAHAGRKAGVPGAIAPSAVAFEKMPVPQEMGAAEIEAVLSGFERSARFAVEAGFQGIELHGAHGYLLHEFLSPISNQRTDEYGGNLENRSRLLREVVQVVRGALPGSLPLFVRISASDWIEGGWDIDESVELSRMLAGLGVDLIDASSGGLSLAQQVRIGPGYQVPFAERIRREAGIPTAAVGLITDAEQADAIVREGKADAVLIARASLRNPYWPIHAARQLGRDVVIPFQYQRGW